MVFQAPSRRALRTSSKAPSPEFDDVIVESSIVDIVESVSVIVIVESVTVIVESVTVG